MELGSINPNLDMGSLQWRFDIATLSYSCCWFCLGFCSGRKGKRVSKAQREVGQHRGIQEHGKELEYCRHNTVRSINGRTNWNDSCGFCAFSAVWL